MFKEFGQQNEPQPSFKDRALRLLAIALGNVDTVQEEVSKINKYGYVGEEKGKKIKIKTVTSDDEFIRELKEGNVTSIDAQINVVRAGDNGLSKEVKNIIDQFDHRIIFQATLGDTTCVEYSVSFGKQMGNGDADTYPYSDTAAMRTYLTGGKALVNLKESFPGISTQLLTSNKGVHLNSLEAPDGKLPFCERFYYHMVESAKKYHVQPWR